MYISHKTVEDADKCYIPKVGFQFPCSHRTTELNTLQGYVEPLMDSERGYLELSLLYMEHRFNIYSIV